MAVTSDETIQPNVGNIATSSTAEQLYHRQHNHMLQAQQRENCDPRDTIERRKSPKHTKHKVHSPNLSQVHLGAPERQPPLTLRDENKLVKVILGPREKNKAPLAFHFRHQHTRPSLLRRLWIHWLTAYRALIGFTFITNFAVLIWYIEIDFSVSTTLTASAVNFLLAILVRQEDLINASYFLLEKTPSKTPLALRKLVADFHHYGGLHIGCACAALMWYCLLAVVSTVQCAHHAYNGKMTSLMWTNMIVVWMFLLSVLVVCVAALPQLRVRFHNTFEHTHRFGGWLATAVLWIHTGIGTLSPGSKPLHKDANLWILVAITFFLILPWLRIRRVLISSESVSRRETKITFAYLNMPYMSTTRFSRHPMMDWHAFATIPSETAIGTEASIIISQVGDWTNSIVENPPSQLWLRKPATRNFLALAPLFNSVLLVATGAGIGPMLSLLSSPAMAKMKEKGKVIKIMWCVYEPQALHWKFVLDVIRRVDEKPRIFDSRQGRPDLAFEARYMAQVHGIEAVMVVSNEKVTNQVVREVKAYHGAAYGAVFDS